VVIGGAPASAASLMQTIAVGSQPNGVSSDGTHVWVANNGSNAVSELNASTGSVVQTISVGTGPAGVSSDGTRVWVANNFDNTVTELNASEGSVVQTIAVDIATDGDGASSDGAHVWVATGNFGTVTELNASDGSVVQTITVGVAPFGVSSDGTHVWVANNGSNTVSELSIVGVTITTSSLPSATPGVAYGPVTLQAANLGISTNPFMTNPEVEEAHAAQGAETVQGRSAIRDPHCQACRRSEFGHGSGDRDCDHPQREEEGQDQDHGSGHDSSDHQLTCRSFHFPGVSAPTDASLGPDGVTHLGSARPRERLSSRLGCWHPTRSR
jgi:YVTN family beta-propeller protein